MEEENKKTGGTFHVVSEKKTYDDDIIEKFNGSGSLSSSETKEESITTKEGRKKVVKTTRTITQEYVTIDLEHGIKAKHVNGKFVVQLPNGSETTISDEELSKWFENGIGDGTYARVSGVREVTVYEKTEVLKTKKKRAFFLLLLLPLLLSLLLSLGRCGKKQNNQGGDFNISDIPDIPDNPDGIVQIDDSINDIDKIVKMIYQQKISEILDVLEPGMIAKETADALDAADYDMELLKKSGCASEDIIDNYGTIYKGIIKPSADYIQRLNTFREAIKNPDSMTPEQMLSTAHGLLMEYQQMVENSIAAVSLHADTTKRCIDEGLRDENYVYPYKHELGVLNEQKQNLVTRGTKITTLLSSFSELDKYKEDIISGKIKYTEVQNGVILFFENGEVQLVQTASFTYSQEGPKQDFEPDQLSSGEDEKTR